MTPLIVLAIVLTIGLGGFALRAGRSERLGSSGPACPAEVQRLIAAGEIISAVKMYRQITGLGLYESKQAVDRIRATGTWEAPAADAAPEADEAVVVLVQEKRFIEAVKLYREKHGVDLATAKNAVDRLARPS